MRAVAALLMRGRFHAITAAAVCGAASLMLPPLTYISGAIVALSTLKQGYREGLLVVVGALVLSAAFSTVMVGSPAPAVAFTVVSWGPAWLMAVALTHWRSQGAALLCATLLGAVAVLVMHLAHDNPVEWWRAVMTQLFAQLVQDQPQSAANLTKAIDLWAPRMTRFFGAATAAGLMLTLVLARWWHASLDNPGGFGREFRALRVQRPVLAVSIGIAVVAIALPSLGQGLLGDLLGPVAVMLGFLGLAVAHAVAVRRRASSAWLVLLYALLLIFPTLVLPALCLAGLVDGWFNLRARVPERT